MANEITINASVTLKKGFLNVQRSNQIRLTMAGNNYGAETITVTPETVALPVSDDILTPGVGWFLNLSTQHNIELGLPVDSGGSEGAFTPFARIPPGAHAVIGHERRCLDFRISRSRKGRRIRWPARN